nr:MAG TPA: hypothetical protein [Caudoviricetes sp.]
MFTLLLSRRRPACIWIESFLPVNYLPSVLPYIPPHLHNSP